MKNSYLTMIVFTIFTISFCSKTQAQKQSRVERLYQHIAWSEGDKYDRLRERMDTKSMDAYKNEITLADALRQLLLTPGINAIEPYLKSDMTIQQQDGGAGYVRSAKQQTSTSTFFVTKQTPRSLLCLFIPRINLKIPVQYLHK